ncbi:MAG: hypothetical protein ACRETD_09445, partial [Steroidobacteraceae bacterium]
MLIVTTVAMASLTALAFAAARNNLFPPVMFAGCWLLTLLGLIASGDLLYPVNDFAYLVYLVGAVAFTAGGLLALCWLGKMPPPAARVFEKSRVTRVALDALLLILVAGFPYYLEVVLGIASSGTDGSLAFVTVRRELVDSAGEGADPLGVIAGNLNVLCQIVALALLYETDGTWSRRWR